MNQNCLTWSNLYLIKTELNSPSKCDPISSWILELGFFRFNIFFLAFFPYLIVWFWLFSEGWSYILWSSLSFLSNIKGVEGDDNEADDQLGEAFVLSWQSLSEDFDNSGSASRGCYVYKTAFWFVILRCIFQIEVICCWILRFFEKRLHKSWPSNTWVNLYLQVVLLTFHIATHIWSCIADSPSGAQSFFIVIWKKWERSLSLSTITYGKPENWL